MDYEIGFRRIVMHSGIHTLIVCKLSVSVPESGGFPVSANAVSACFVIPPCTRFTFHAHRPCPLQYSAPNNPNIGVNYPNHLACDFLTFSCFHTEILVTCFLVTGSVRHGTKR